MAGDGVDRRMRDVGGLMTKIGKIISDFIIDGNPE